MVKKCNNFDIFYKFVTFLTCRLHPPATWKAIRTIIKKTVFQIYLLSCMPSLQKLTENAQKTEMMENDKLYSQQQKDLKIVFFASTCILFSWLTDLYSILIHLIIVSLPLHGRAMNFLNKSCTKNHIHRHLAGKTSYISLAAEHV